MKTLITQTALQPKAISQSILPTVAISISETLAAFSAVVSTTLIVFLSIWVASMEVSNISAAVTWGLGFVFAGLAVDGRGLTALLQVITAVSLLLLAYLQNYISADFVIAAGALLATWSAGIVFRQLKRV